MQVCLAHLSHLSIMDQCTENMNVWLLQIIKSNKLEDQIFWYNMTHNEFKLGSKILGNVKRFSI